MNQLYRSTSFFELPAKLAGRLRRSTDNAEDGVLDLDSRSHATKTCFNLSK
jgi:predicted translin family RNA/ssDNA-binding protein